jgi:hypothetical protein
MPEAAPTPSPFLADAAALYDVAEALRAQMGDRRASVELSFATAPDHWGFLVFAGTGPLLSRLESAWFADADLAELRRHARLGPLLARSFESLRCKLDIDAAPEGAMVFPDEPVLTLEGPLAQILLAGPVVRSELARATTAATRAARLATAASGDEVIDASSIDPAAPLTIARAAFIGGCAGTRNLTAAGRFDIPLHAAATDGIMALCRAPMPPEGSDSWGVSPTDRIGLLAPEDEEGDLLERRRQGERARWHLRSLARPSMLSTRCDLVALQEGPAWAPRAGYVADPAIWPGRKLVIRYLDESGRPVADLLQAATERIQPAPSAALIGALGPTCPLWIEGAHSAASLANPVLREGRMAAAAEPLSAVRERAIAAIRSLDPSVRRLRAPAKYVLGASAGLYELRGELFARTSQR